MKYSKPPLPIEEQLNLLISRGLIVNNTHKAIHYLNNISYYRLRAYMLAYQNPNDPEHYFFENISFDSILNLYIFDRELRLLLFDAIERIEIAIRTQIIFQFSIEYGFDFYLKKDLFRSLEIFNQTTKKLTLEIERSHEIFLKHFKEKYKKEIYPPSIMALEVSSFGTLSKIYRNFKMCKAKKLVANQFGLHPYILESWMQSTTYIRNIVAHHGRLWNRKLTTRPTLLEYVPNKKTWLSSNNIASNKIYAFLACVMYLKKTINPGTEFNSRLKNLFLKYNEIDISKMGFPKNWEKEKLWI